MKTLFLIATIVLGTAGAAAASGAPDKVEVHEARHAQHEAEHGKAPAGTAVDATAGSQGAHDDPHAAAGHHGDPTEHINWFTPYVGKFDKQQGFIWMVFNFTLLIGLMMWKVRPMAKQFAETRHTEIKSALDEAAKLRAEAQAQVEEYGRKLREAEGEVDKLLADIRADALSEKQRIIASAEQQAEALKRDAEQRIAAEIERARRELEQEVVAAAISIAEKILREKTSTADHNKLIEGFLGDVSQVAKATREERT